MILPVMKLGTLALRTLSKPLANRLKREAANHPRFRAAIIGLAQANHRFSINVQRRIYGHSLDVAIRPLDEEKAVQAATDLLGESFIFGVGGAVVIFEVSRNARSEARKEAARKQEILELQTELEALKRRLDEFEQSQKSRGLSNLLPGAGVFRTGASAAPNNVNGNK